MNYYSAFSEKIRDLTDKERFWILDQLEPYQKKDIFGHEFERWCRDRGIEDPGDGELWPRFDWEVEGKDPHRNLWLHSEENFNLDHVVLFVQRFLQKFRPKSYFRLSHCYYCDKPIPGEFGGGAVVITADHTEYFDATSLAETYINNKLNKELEKEEKSAKIK